MESKEIKPHPRQMEEVKVTQFSPYRRMGTKDRVYHKMGQQVWNTNIKEK